ncbi:CDF family Co(II)/Ni(II) efflux transporter DmeF [uncultured Shewanella sp.]|uniref:CDF family Co(II)/Ni(II) efflux transporter DmeF n=1 Tax=uncultured Shewanella sp. TaxID=173975 RepID=UPI0026220C4D|nr:CDF family Co(II)/Ni(II) efflux transporter DmeF [uncultured Shewanella sp.]
MSTKPHSLSHWQHKHQYTNINHSGERNTRYVLYLTIITMFAEIIAGTFYGSMALLADGWHMGTHAAAFMITLFAFKYARKHADSPNFSFGTGKVSVLGGFTSAVALGLVALIMIFESAFRLLNPQSIQFNQAILVAVIGLTVNVLSAFLLKDHHSHSHHHDGHHSHGEHSHDHNLRAAYFHVLADALTSLFAIGALLMGKFFGLNWLDPVMGIIGSIIISRWAWGLLKQTSPILLDANIDADYQAQIVALIEDNDDHQVSDIHIWAITSDHYAAIIAIVSHDPKDVDYFKQQLTRFDKLSHVTIEINLCRQNDCSGEKEAIC